MYNLKDYHPRHFSPTLSNKKLEEVYYRMLDDEHKMVDELWDNVSEQEQVYLVYLVHEGRGAAGTAISSVLNLDFYKEKKPENEYLALRKECFHRLLQFCVYMMSLTYFYNFWKLSKKE